MEFIKKLLVGTFAVAALTLSSASSARAQDMEDEMEEDFAPPPPEDLMAPVEEAAPAPTPVEPSEDAAFATIPDEGAAMEEETFGSMDEENFEWGEDISGNARGRVGVRGGVYVPGSASFAAGPTTSFFWQKEMGSITVELGLGFAQVARQDDSSSSFLVIGGAGAQYSFYRGESRSAYVQAGLGATSETAESSDNGERSFLSSVDLALGLLSSRAIDVRAGMSVFTNSDNVDSAAFVSLGVLY
jgi:hypothetical protein